MQKIIISILIISTLFSCKPCPSSYTWGVLTTPVYIKELAQKYDKLENLAFISENNDTINFSRVEEENVQLVSYIHRTVPCIDGVGMVDLIFEGEISRYSFASNLGDTIKFTYRPSITSDSYDYLEVGYQFYHNIMIFLPDFETKIREGRAAWKEPRSTAFFDNPLNEIFEVSNISYDNVFSWSAGRQRAIFYDYENGLIGFTDENGTRWIRKK